MFVLYCERAVESELLDLRPTPSQRGPNHRGAFKSMLSFFSATPRQAYTSKQHSMPMIAACFCGLSEKQTANPVRSTGRTDSLRHDAKMKHPHANKNMHPVQSGPAQMGGRTGGKLLKMQQNNAHTTCIHHIVGSCIHQQNMSPCPPPSFLKLI